MFVIPLYALLLIAAMKHHFPGLSCWFKNKGRDIGILRTMGFDRRLHPAGVSLSVARVSEFLGHVCGGRSLGCPVRHSISTPIFTLVNLVSGAGVAGPRPFGGKSMLCPRRSARLEDVLKSVALSLSLSFIVHLFPRVPARPYEPGKACRYE